MIYSKDVINMKKRSLLVSFLVIILSVLTANIKTYATKGEIGIKCNPRLTYTGYNGQASYSAYVKWNTAKTDRLLHIGRKDKDGTLTVISIPIDNKIYPDPYFTCHPPSLHFEAADEENKGTQLVVDINVEQNGKTELNIQFRKVQTGGLLSNTYTCSCEDTDF